MRVIISKNYEDMSSWAANYIIEKIHSAEHAQDSRRSDHGNTASTQFPTNKPFVLGLPTGASPLGMYRELISAHKRGELSFRGVETFNMDEYVGLAPESPQSYHYFMWHNFFSHIDVEAERVHIPNGMAEDLHAECLAYEEAMREVGGVDLFVAGIGRDGHIAFNEPGSSLASRTRIKTITQDTRIANARFFGDCPERVPATVLTVGVASVMDARELMLLASGRDKAPALEHVIQQGLNHLWTASCLQLHPQAVIVCDEEACSDLKYSTVRYFKDVEAGH